MKHKQTVNDFIIAVAASTTAVWLNDNNFFEHFIAQSWSPTKIFQNFILACMRGHLELTISSYTTLLQWWTFKLLHSQAFSVIYLITISLIIIQIHKLTKSFFRTIDMKTITVKENSQLLKTKSLEFFNVSLLYYASLL